MILLLALPGDAAAREDDRFPVHPFSGDSRGPYRTGTFQVYWIDESRDEPNTLDVKDKRRVTAQVWYPADVHDGEPLAPYMLTPDQYLLDIDPAEHGDLSKLLGRRGYQHQLQWARLLRHVLTTSVLDADPIRGKGRHPVLLYNHGGGFPHFSGTFQTEYLASHGYVVVAVNHPGMDGILRWEYPDGYVYRQWVKPKPQVFESSRGQSRRWLRGRYEQWFSGEAGDLALAVQTMVQDLSFVLDRLEEMDRDPSHRLHGRLDLQRVGSLGWSIGGATSLQASLDETRIKAAIAQDSFPYGLTGPKGVATLGSPAPIMVMSGGRPGLADIEGKHSASVMELMAAVDLHMAAMFERGEGDWYRLRIAHAEHGSFSDVALMLDQSLGQDRPEVIHPRLAHDIVNRYSLEFFDKYLRGSVDTPFLSEEKSYREASLQYKSDIDCPPAVCIIFE